MRHVEILVAFLSLALVSVSFIIPTGLFGVSRHIGSTLLMSSTENPPLAKNVVIPEDKLLFSYARCSGPGTYLYLFFSSSYLFHAFKLLAYHSSITAINFANLLLSNLIYVLF
jgi:hypothetical protein